MATTRSGPAFDWSKAGSDLWSLTLDTARSKLVDVEQVGDERTVPDMTDLRTGNVPMQTATGSAAPQVQNAQGQPGMNMSPWMIGGLVVAAGAVVYLMAD
ncbi:hypothetical protein [Marinobacter sp.]|uniref:hypothetical protein n=1 Tax=Marinobacter sp. TaxID=50741 RepID=UPI0035C6F5B9